jgi:hypothetical protein
VIWEKMENGIWGFGEGMNVNEWESY